MFVLSIYEGFGNVLVEAGIFKFNNSIIVWPTGNFKNGKFGDLVNVGDNKKLSNLIIKNLKNKNKNKISKMFNSLKKYNIKKHINSMKKFLKKFKKKYFFCPSMEEGGVEKFN